MDSKSKSKSASATTGGAMAATDSKSTDKTSREGGDAAASVASMVAARNIKTNLRTNEKPKELGAHYAIASKTSDNKKKKNRKSKKDRAKYPKKREAKKAHYNKEGTNNVLAVKHEIRRVAKTTFSHLLARAVDCGAVSFDPDSEELTIAEEHKDAFLEMMGQGAANEEEEAKPMTSAYFREAMLHSGFISLKAAQGDCYRYMHKDKKFDPFNDAALDEIVVNQVKKENTASGLGTHHQKWTNDNRFAFATWMNLNPDFVMKRLTDAQATEIVYGRGAHSLRHMMKITFGTTVIKKAMKQELFQLWLQKKETAEAEAETVEPAEGDLDLKPAAKTEKEAAVGKENLTQAGLAVGKKKSASRTSNARDKKKQRNNAGLAVGKKKPSTEQPTMQMAIFEDDSVSEKEFKSDSESESENDEVHRHSVRPSSKHMHNNSAQDAEDDWFDHE